MTAAAPWWQRRWCVAAALVLAAVPLLWPAIPPLTDLPGHIGRYRILADDGAGPLGAHYAIHWALIGNLGVDLLVLALHPLLDVEPAARLVVTLIPVLTVAAMLWLAHEAHGRIPPAAGFALPLAYGFPFQLGFVNFCLSAALALAGLAWWLRLARTRPAVVRVLVFAGVAPLVWIVHSFGWAMLGLFVFGAEWQLRSAAGRVWWRAAITAAAMALPMAWPALLLVGGADAMRGDTGDWFDGAAKAQWAVSLLRERWKWWDVGGVVVLACLLWGVVRSTRLRFVPVLGIPALLGLAVFVVTPRLFQGGAYVDMRLLPYSVALAVLAIRVAPGEDALARRLAIGGAAFFIARIAVTTAAFMLYAQRQDAALAVVPALPVGSAVLVLVDEPDSGAWTNPRLKHIAGIALARRRVFVNEQWALAGQQLIRPRHPGAAPYDRDPSQVVLPRDGGVASTDFDAAIARFDRCTFTYVWTVGFPAGRARATDLVPAWHDDRSALYRVVATQNACRAPR